MTTPDPVEGYLGWQVKTCTRCAGRGVVAGGHDMMETVDCSSCFSGAVYISPKGRAVAYPGGPFLGGQA